MNNPLLSDPAKSSSSSVEKKSGAAASLSKLKDFMTAPGGDYDGMKDMNQKLQIMLEETLTKNMHLQQVRANSASGSKMQIGEDGGNLRGSLYQLTVLVAWFTCIDIKLYGGL